MENRQSKVLIGLLILASCCAFLYLNCCGVQVDLAMEAGLQEAEKLGSDTSSSLPEVKVLQIILHKLLSVLTL